MKIDIKENKEKVEFGSLHEFYDYICNTPINDSFRWKSLSSVNGSKSFTKTVSFEEATDLFKKGWSDMASKLVQKLKVAEQKTMPTMKPKTTLGVAGYQSVVPLYLNGIPTNMVNTKMVPVKQKIITINKSIDYSASVSAERIVEESIKALQIVKKLESQGFRCNLNIVLGAKAGKKQFIIKVRIKSANEKLNVSKLAFPLVHPSMLRRLFFRFIEVHPTVTDDFIYGYGCPASTYELRTSFPEDYLLPSFIKKDVTQIAGIEDLENA